MVVVAENSLTILNKISFEVGGCGVAWAKRAFSAIKTISGLYGNNLKSSAKLAKNQYNPR